MEGRFNGGFFALPVWGAYIWRGLYTEGLIFGILRIRCRIKNEYRKIPKISPGAYIFQRPFLRGLIFGGAYIRREVLVSKSARLIIGGKFASLNRLG